MCIAMPCVCDPEVFPGCTGREDLRGLPVRSRRPLSAITSAVTVRKAEMEALRQLRPNDSEEALEALTTSKTPWRAAASYHWPTATDATVPGSPSPLTMSQRRWVPPVVTDPASPAPSQGMRPSTASEASDAAGTAVGAGGARRVTRCSASSTAAATRSALRTAPRLSFAKPPPQAARKTSTDVRDRTRSSNASNASRRTPRTSTEAETRPASETIVGLSGELARPVFLSQVKSLAPDFSKSGQIFSSDLGGNEEVRPRSPPSAGGVGAGAIAFAPMSHAPPSTMCRTAHVWF